MCVTCIHGVTARFPTSWFMSRFSAGLERRAIINTFEGKLEAFMNIDIKESAGLASYK